MVISKFSFMFVYDYLMYSAFELLLWRGLSGFSQRAFYDGEGGSSELESPRLAQRFNERPIFRYSISDIPT